MNTKVQQSSAFLVFCDFCKSQSVLCKQCFSGNNARITEINFLFFTKTWPEKKYGIYIKHRFLKSVNSQTRGVNNSEALDPERAKEDLGGNGKSTGGTRSKIK